MLPKIIDYIPNNQLDISKINFPNKLELADSVFHVPSKISLLIGCELFFELLKPENFKSSDG